MIAGHWPPYPASPLTPNSVCTPAGDAKASACVESQAACSEAESVHPGLLTIMPTAIAYLGVAPRKNADCDRFVVPVFAMIVWPLVRPRPLAVPIDPMSKDRA